MGFDRVEIAENLKGSELRRVLSRIAERAAQTDIVLVFYAGHDVEMSGLNYLIPTDTKRENDNHIKRTALAFADLTSAAGKARRGALVIVDTCRDDSFMEARAAALSRGADAQKNWSAPKKLHAGLAVTPSASPNSVIFHSTHSGQVALDEEDLESPFVRALLETLTVPNQPFDAVLQETTMRVREATQGRQLPPAYGTTPAIALLPPSPVR